MHEINTLSSKVVYQNRWMTVREDAIERQDGSHGIYGVIEKQDFAVIAAVHEDEVFLVQQYRYPIRTRVWELPQGSWTTGTGSALDLAKTELLEETGIAAQEMRHASRLHIAYGYSTQAFDVFLARGLSFGAQQLENEEQGLICKAFRISDVIDMICAGDITDSATVATFGLLRLKHML
jgi:ADP-ribose pyrophosphatase